MLHLVIGGAASGKSRYAEALTVKYAAGRPLVYLATMAARDEESLIRIKKHREARKGFPFETLEKSRRIGEVLPALLPESCLLLEDIPNLVANELFCAEAEPALFSEMETAAAVCRITEDITQLALRCFFVTVVTGELFTGGSRYSRETLLYLRVLAEVNRRLAEQADSVTELVCGCANMIKNENDLTVD